MDAMNKSTRSGIGNRSGVYSTIGRNAQMPEGMEQKICGEFASHTQTLC